MVAPRKYATVRHAGELSDRRGLVDELHLARLPLVPLILRKNGPNGHAPAPQTHARRADSD